MHSEIKLSTVISRLVAKEIVDNVQLEDLGSCRIFRFYNNKVEMLQVIDYRIKMSLLKLF